jgi:mRNA-degrading endonuclease RelE of RelBE toxin-antitoxin system
MVMTKRRPFEVEYAAQTRQHLEAIDKKHHSLIRDAIELQLLFEPQVETRNRKPLLRDVDFGEIWELRCGPNNCFRIFYSIDDDAQKVLVLAIGWKKGNRVFIGGQEIKL